MVYVHVIINNECHLTFYLEKSINTFFCVSISYWCLAHVIIQVSQIVELSRSEDRSSNLPSNRTWVMSSVGWQCSLLRSYLGRFPLVSKLVTSLSWLSSQRKHLAFQGTSGPISFPRKVIKYLIVDLLQQQINL